MARHARLVIPLDATRIRADARKAVALKFERPVHPVERLKLAAEIVNTAEADLADDELTTKHRESLLSLCFYADLEGLARFSGLSRPTFNGMLGKALGLPAKTQIPAGADGAAAARAAGIREIPEDQAINNLVEAASKLLPAQERRDVALVFRQDAALALSLPPYDWTSPQIAEVCGVPDIRVRKDWELARKRLPPA
jgi:hypothetical protein